MSSYHPLPGDRKDNSHQTDLAIGLGRAEGAIIAFLTDRPDTVDGIVSLMGEALKGIREARGAALEIAEIHKYWNERLQDGD